MNFRPNFLPRKNIRINFSKAKSYDPVTKYMATDLITFKPDQNINEVIETMISNEISGAMVLDDNGQIVGVISEKDCLRVIIDSAYHNEPLNKRKVKDFMTNNEGTLSVENDVVDAANAFLNCNFRRFPVVDKGKLVGQVSRRDILRAAKNIPATTW